MNTFVYREIKLFFTTLIYNLPVFSLHIFVAVRFGGEILV